MEFMGIMAFSLLLPFGILAYQKYEELQRKYENLEERLKELEDKIDNESG